MTPSHAETLAARLDSKTARVCVIGLGYVGLPLGVALGQAGFDVHGIDVSPEKVNLVNDGRSYVGDIPDHEVKALHRVPLSPCGRASSAGRSGL